MSQDETKNADDRSANGHCVSGAEVRERELDEIVRRRSVALPSNGSAEGTKSSVESVRNNLVGLAFSGGGLRSGAFSLGVLQAFHKRGILKFIDYLSTVSGGGYAGAFFSSISLRTKDSDAPSDTRNRGDLEGLERNHPTDPMFPIEDGVNGYQPPRMLDFMFNARYLAKTWMFLNRYLIGLLMIWIVVLSGAIAMASFLAWSFRSLDSIGSRSWLRPLSFDSDVRLAFFPAFVLLVLWFVAWTFSYVGALTFKDVSRCTGTVARLLFYLLIGASAIAVAALFGNGDVSLNSEFLEEISRTIPKGTVRTLIFTVIVASLLPYLTPKRLLRSGSDPRNTKEKYIFWVATRALAFGVPFIIFAFFAREDISGWNERRDSRLTPSGIRGGWDASSPIWGQVLDKKTYADSKRQLGRIWKPESDIGELEKVLNDLAKLQLSVQGKDFDLDELEDLLAEQDSSDKKRLPSVDWQRDRYIAESRPPKDVELSFLSRWGYLLEYLNHRLLNNVNQYKANRLYKMAKNFQESHAIEWEIVGVLNRRLQDPEFYQTLLPNLDKVGAAETEDKEKDAVVATSEWEEAFLLVSNLHPDADESSDHKKRFEKWINNLKTIRTQAKALVRNSNNPVATLDDDSKKLAELEHTRKVIDVIDGC